MGIKLRSSKISFTKYNHIIMYSSQVLANAALARSYVAPLPTVDPVVNALRRSQVVAPLASTVAPSTLGWGYGSTYAGYPYGGLGVSSLGVSGLAGYPYGGYAGLGYRGLAGYPGYAGLGYGGYAGLGYSGLGYRGLGYSGLAGYPYGGLGYSGLGYAGLGSALRRSQVLLGLGATK